MATGTHATPEIEYPSADGEPMAETPVHRDVTIDLIVMLTIYLRTSRRCTFRGT